MNKSILDLFSSKELELYNIVINTSGLMEERTAQLEEQGIFKQYQIIHQKYVEAIKQSRDTVVQIESAKRSIFLNWYHFVEPSCFTGIFELNQTSIKESYEFLNNLIQNGDIDDEFTWMLSYYCSLDYAILFYVGNELKTLYDFVKTVDTSNSHIPEKQILEKTMINRGQMGIYWNSLN